jgi:hypothetical protein
MLVKVLLTELQKIEDRIIARELKASHQDAELKVLKNAILNVLSKSSGF